jgi:hypothetical protein
MKRNSPSITQHPRPPKMMYADISECINSDLMLHPSAGGMGHHQSSSSVGPLMSPEINSMTSDDRHLRRMPADDGKTEFY